jgi:6,7-dimethyl-8-ribityllumazine synthase
VDWLAEHGADGQRLTVAWVPGAFELPWAVERLIRATGADAAVALGCVIRGETPHFDYVCEAAATGLREVASATGVPVGFGVLTCDTEDQARARLDKGAEAADAAVRLATLARA